MPVRSFVDHTRRHELRTLKKLAAISAASGPFANAAAQQLLESQPLLGTVSAMSGGQAPRRDLAAVPAACNAKSQRR